MANPSKLFSSVDFGDYPIIAEIYNSRHKNEGETITSSYVGKVLRGERPGSPGTAAEEIQEIAITYLSNKMTIKRQLMIA